MFTPLFERLFEWQLSWCVPSAQEQVEIFNSSEVPLVIGDHNMLEAHARDHVPQSSHQFHFEVRTELQKFLELKVPPPILTISCRSPTSLAPGRWESRFWEREVSAWEMETCWSREAWIRSSKGIQ